MLKVYKKCIVARCLSVAKWQVPCFDGNSKHVVNTVVPKTRKVRIWHPGTDQRSDIWQMVKTKIRSKNSHKCTKIGSFGVKKPLNCGCPRKCGMDMVASGADGQKESDAALALCQGMRATPIFHFLGNLRRGAPMGG